MQGAVRGLLSLQAVWVSNVEDGLSVQTRRQSKSERFAC